MDIHRNIQLYLPSKRGGLAVLCGQRAASQPLLRICAHLSLSGIVHILDCGNRSNMYTVAKMLRGLTRDPAPALKNVRLARAFTCYQCEALFRNNSRLTDTTVLVLDLLATFFDESVARKEAERVFRASLDQLLLLSRRVPVLVGISSLNRISSDPADFVSLLYAAADAFHLITDSAVPVEPERQRSFFEEVF